MATSTDQTFIMAAITAESVRQGARATALATYTAAGFTPAARTTYVTAYIAADTAYTTAVNSARSTANLSADVAGFQPLGEEKAATYRAEQGIIAPGPPPTMHTDITPTQARAWLAALKSDPEWANKLLAGSPTHRRTFENLVAAQGDVVPDGVEAADSLSDRDALRRTDYESGIASLREDGALPASSEEYLRARDAGLTDYAPTQGDGAAFRAGLDRYLKNPETRAKYLAGDLEVSAQVHNMLRVVAMAAQDSQPVTKEGIEILTKLGLR
jgi:hypothetical protein